MLRAPGIAAAMEIQLGGLYVLVLLYEYSRVLRDHVPLQLQQGHDVLIASSSHRDSG